MDEFKDESPAERRKGGWRVVGYLVGGFPVVPCTVYRSCVYRCRVTFDALRYGRRCIPG